MFFSILILFLISIPPSHSVILSCARGMYCPTDISNITSNGQVAYYSFWSENRLADGSGITGALNYVTGTAQYASDGQWTGSQSLVATTAMRIDIPNMQNSMYWTIQTGLMICLWYKHSLSNSGHLFYFGPGNWNAPFLQLLYDGTYGLKIQYYSGSQSVWSYGGTSNGALEGTWYHTCVSLYQNTIQTFWNANLVGTGDITNIRITPRTDNLGGIGCYYFASGTANYVGRLDEFRVFNRVLSASEVTQIYNFREYPCPPGTANDLVNQRVCPPCPPNTYQPYPGQAVCLSCSSAGNTYYGSTSCVAANSAFLGPLPWAGGSTTPGTATYSVGANSVSMNCPSGTYSTSVSTMIPNTTSCFISSYTTVANPCPGTGCCIWASSQYSSSYLLSYAFNGLAINGASADRFSSKCSSVSNDWIGISFGQSTYVDSVLLFDTSVPFNNLNILVYVGNSLVNNNPTYSYSTPPSSFTGYSYFTSSPSNTLCYNGSTTDQGYRNPLWVSCKTSGLYLYIVTGGTCMTYSEIVVLSQPPCTLCPPGTYSHYTTASTTCTDCPAGTYSTGSGASACTTCAAGTWQPLSGQANCILNIAAGYYVTNQQPLLMSSNLIAYYTFSSTGRTVDSTGKTGLLTASDTSPTFSSDATGPYAYSEYAKFDGTSQYFNLPPMNFGAMSASTGFSICAWFYVVSFATNYQRIWEIFDGGQNVIFIDFATSQLNIGWGAGGNTATFGSLPAVTSLTWHFLCVTNQGNTWNRYYDGGSPTTVASSTVTLASVTITTNRIGYGTYSSTPKYLNGFIDDFRIYNTALTAAQVADVYTYKMALACPAGSFQDLANQDTCKPCGIGYYSSTVGATACTTACAGCTWYGSSANTGTLASTYTYGATTNTPGRAQYTVGANTMSFNCPSGTYSSSVFQVNPVRTTCDLCDSNCCAWALNYYGTNVPAFALDASFTTNRWIGMWLGNVNMWFAIDFKSSIYIDSVAIIENFVGGGSLNKFSLYIGNTYVYNPAQLQATPNANTIYDYPTSSNTNTLCFADGTNLYGYRNPLVVRCQAWGQYLYVVTPQLLAIQEIIVTNTSICTLCSPGTYSYNTIPTVRCSQCPAGTYQSGVGKSYCDSCATGTYQSGVGMTSADNCVGINSGLVAYYTFTPGGRLKDSTGITGDLTYPNTVSPKYADNGLWKGSQVLNSVGLVIPAMNPGAMALASGFSACLWYVPYYSTNAVYILFFSASGADRIYIAANSPGSTLTFYTANGGIPSSSSRSFSWPVTYGVWKHLCLVLLQTSSSVGSTQLYEDGQMVYSGTTVGLRSISMTTNYIGTGALQASFDEVRMYNRTLSAAEVLNIYNFRNFQANAEGFCRAGTYCPLRAASSNANLIAYYSFWSDNRLLDATGITGSLTASGTITYAADGKWTGSNVATFSGSQYYQLPSFNLYQYSNTSGFSVCMWFMFSTTASDARVFDFGQGQQADNLQLYRTGVSAGLVLYVAQGSTFTTWILPQQIVNTQWRHLCIVNQAKSWVIYDNGQPVLFQTTAFYLNSVMLSSSYIAKSNWNTVYGGINVDELRIYNAALTADQVLDVYNFRNWQCPAGAYCPVGSSEPIQCPLSTYQPSTGSSACTNCDVGKYTLSAGMTSASMCVTC